MTSVTVSRTASLSKTRKVSWSMGHLLLLKCAPILNTDAYT
jgi:hypothetical protein